MQDGLIAFFCIFVLIMNCISFAMMGVDKRLAQRHLHRVSERALFLYALPFSALGGWIGMRYFHHKTQKAQFVYGFPLMIAAQVALAYFLGRSLL